MTPEPRSFQSVASEQGRQFASQCDVVLEEHGFELSSGIVLSDLGVEIDRVGARDGRTVWFEYKGSVRGRRPGLRRTDTLKKAIANGALLMALEEHPPYVLLTSHMPERGSGLAMLSAARQLGYFAEVICLYSPAEVVRLDRL